MSLFDRNQDGKNDITQWVSQKYGAWKQENTRKANLQQSRRQAPQFDTDTSHIQQTFQEFTKPQTINVEPLHQKFFDFKVRRTPVDIKKLYREKVEAPAIQYSNDFSDRFQNSLVGRGLDKAGKTASGIADWTIRPIITRPVAKGIVSLADIATKNQEGPKRLTSLPVNDSAGKLLFGKEDLTSYQQDSRNAVTFFEKLGIGTKTAGTLGISAGVINALLDLPGGSIFKKPAKEVIEKVGKKAVVELAEEVTKKEGREILTSPQTQKRLWGLLNSRDVLKKAGWADKAISKLKPKEALNVIENQYSHMIPDFLKNGKEVIEKQVDGQGIKNVFADWVNARRSGEITAIRTKKAFEKHDSEGLTSIFKAQAGKLPDVKKYFDDIYKELQSIGGDFGYKDNYLPQLWSNSKEEVEQVFKSLGKNAPFTKSSVFQNYKEGLEANLKPRFSKLSDLVGWYQKSAEKMKADRMFLNYLEANKLIAVGKDVQPGWIRITAQGFPTKKIKVGEELVEHFYSAAPELAKKINNYLNGSTIEGLEKVADYASWAKNLKLAGGVPSTGLNAHGMNILVRSTLARNNPIGGLFQTGEWILRPGKASKYVDEALTRAERYSRHGLTLSTEGFSFTPDKKIVDGNVIQKAYKVLGNSFDKYLGDPLFRKVIPATKIRLMDEVVEGLVKSGIDEKQAMREGSKIVNNMLGGINYDQIARNSDVQNMLRSVILAPDWAESTLKTGKGVVKGLYKWRDPLLKQYRVFARNMMFSLIGKSLIEYGLSGQANKEGLFKFDTNSFTKGGKKRVFRLFGTGADMFRIPFETAEQLLKGNPGAVGRIITNRLSIPASSGLHLLQNENYFGQPLLGKDKYRNPIPIKQQISGFGSEISNLAGIPPQIGVTANLITGAITPEEAFNQAIESPMRFYGGKGQYESSQKKYETLQKAGLEGEELYQAMKKPKKEGFFSGLFNKNAETDDEIPTDPVLKEIYLDKKSDDDKARIREVFSMGLQPLEIDKVLQEEGLGSYSDGVLLVIKNLGVENGARGRAVKQLLSNLQGDELKAKVQYLGVEKILTTSVIKQWVLDGVITQVKADWLKTTISQKTSSGSGKKSISIKKTAMPSTGGRISLPVIKFKSPKLTAGKQTFKPLSIEAPEINWENIEKELQKIVNEK